MALASASYDAATRTATLVPQNVPFDPGRALGRLVFQPLSGTSDLFVSARPFRYFNDKRAVTFTDQTRSKVKLRLTRPGQLHLMQQLLTDFGDSDSVFAFDPASLRTKVLNRGNVVKVWIEGATPDSVLSGTVTARGRRGDATTPFVQIFNPGGARLDLLNNPGFQVTG
jgi:hypothetical protein